MLTNALRLVASAVLTTKTFFENLGNTIGGVAAASGCVLRAASFRARGQIIRQTREDNLANMQKLGDQLGSLWNGVAEGAEKAKRATKGVGDSALQSAADFEKFEKVLAKDYRASRTAWTRRSSPT
jgi:hypothetical protein